MSQSQKQGTVTFIKKSSGPLEKSSPADISVPGLSIPSNNAPPTIDQSVASYQSEIAGYRLRSMDKQLAFSVLEAIPLLDQKFQKKFREIAVSRKFRDFETLVKKDPHLALSLKILEEGLPEAQKI